MKPRARAHIYSCIYLFVHISIRAYIYSYTYLFVHISIRAYIYSCIYLFVHISIRARIHCLLCCIQMLVHFSKSPINEAWLMQQRVWLLIFFGSLATATGNSFSSKSSFIKISKLNYCLNFLVWLRMKTEKFLFPKLKMWLYLRYFLVFFLRLSRSSKLFSENCRLRTSKVLF